MGNQPSSALHRLPEEVYRIRTDSQPSSTLATVDCWFGKSHFKSKHAFFSRGSCHGHVVYIPFNSYVSSSFNLLGDTALLCHSVACFCCGTVFFV